MYILDFRPTAVLTEQTNRIILGTKHLTCNYKFIITESNKYNGRPAGVFMERTV